MNASELDADFFQNPSQLSKVIGMGTGVMAFVVNLFILFTFLLTKQLRSTSALMITLTAAHALNGAANSAAGFWFLFYDETSMVTGAYCVFTVVPQTFLALYQLLPIILALNAMERLVALVAPIWNHKYGTQGHQWRVVAAVWALGLVLIVGNGAVGWWTSGTAISARCIITEIFSLKYLVFGVHSVAITGGVLATVCTSVAVHRARGKMATMPKNSPNELGRVKKQLRLTKCLLMICVIDVICVVVPNLALISLDMGLLLFPLRYAYYLTIVYSSDSVWNIAAFLLFNTEFRKAVSKMIPCKKPIGTVNLFVKGSTQKGSNVLRRGMVEKH